MNTSVGNFKPFQGKRVNFRVKGIIYFHEKSEKPICKRLNSFDGIGLFMKPLTESPF